ncbi:hypothetical protein AVEN_241526-1 [Araneus ventricosus]|uniref:Uncharacterized protein n=1 Tax=Araneus ventricosus TaxID=182803 RepID=A0A4Y2LEH7_ARAVE|nr:hypothetical protein AVEN_241526-1 [Araneus ventricosus]
MTRTTPELAPPLQTSAPLRREDIWSLPYDLACNRPHTRWIFKGIGFRTATLRSRGRDPTTRPPRPFLHGGFSKETGQHLCSSWRKIRKPSTSSQ